MGDILSSFTFIPPAGGNSSNVSNETDYNMTTATDKSGVIDVSTTESDAAALSGTGKLNGQYWQFYFAMALIQVNTCPSKT